METLYRIMEYGTTGWVDSPEANTTKLTKDQCKIRLDELIAEGCNPKYLKVVFDD
tara:strand:- start:3048 stop:3212 length:165 start_codon:yes stop_codon:yes gene_type:complete